MATYKRYQKYQKYVNGEPTDEYREGEFIDTGEYDSLEDCEGGAIYEWRDDESQYICVDWHSYYRAYRYKSLDGGKTWTKTSLSYRQGSLKEWESAECGWKLLEEWRPTGVTKCVGTDLSTEFERWESRDMGETWNATGEFKYEIVGEEGQFNIDCVTQMEPMVFEVTTEEDNMEIWLEACFDWKKWAYENIEMTNKYYMNFGESDEILSSYTADYGEQYGGAKGQILTNNQWPGVQSNYPAKPRGYVYAKAGTYQIKFWTNSLVILGALWNISFEGDVHKSLILSGEKMSFKIKSWGELAQPKLIAINMSGSSLTEICDGSEFLASLSPKTSLRGGNEDISSISAGKVGHYQYSYSTSYLGEMTIQEMSRSSVNINLSATKLTSLSPNLLKFGSGIKHCAFNNLNIDTVPKELFSPCPEIYMISNIFTDCSISTLPAGLFNGLNIRYAESAFRRLTNIEEIPDLGWTGRPTANYMCQGCTKLKTFDNFVNPSYMNHMFENCESLTECPSKISAFYGCSYMFSQSGITEIPYGLWESVNVNAGTYDHMFTLCRSLEGKIEATLTMETLKSSMVRMFSYCSRITEVDLKFPNLLEGQQDKGQYMFSNCTRLEKTNEDMFREDATDLSMVDHMFWQCDSLANWPKVGDKNLWDFSCFYDVLGKPNHLKYMYTFLGCGPIVRDVPVEFGGIAIGGTSYEPIELEVYGVQYMQFNLNGSANITTGKNPTFVRSIDANPNLYLGGDLQTIFIYTTADSWSTSQHILANDNAYVKIKNFGSHAYLSSWTASSYLGDKAPLTYLGADQGSLLTLTELPSWNTSKVEEISPDFFKYATNLNTLSLNLQSLREFPEGLFDPVKDNLTSLSINLGDNPVLTNLDDFGANFPNCLDWRITADAVLSANRILKNAQGTINSCSLGSVISAEEAFEGTALDNEYGTRRYNSLVNNISKDLKNGVRMFKDCTKLGSIDYLVVLNNGADFTEHFKGCTRLMVDTNLRFTPGNSLPRYNNTTYKILDDLKIDMTGFFEGCSNLNQIPKIQGYLSSEPSVWSHDLWKVPGIIGTRMFRGTKFESWESIPDDWK